MYKIIIDFIIDGIKVCSMEMPIEGYRTIDDIDNYIDDKQDELIHTALYSNKDIDEDDSIWLQAIEKRYHFRGEYIYSIMPTCSW